MDIIKTKKYLEKFILNFNFFLLDFYKTEQFGQKNEI